MNGNATNPSIGIWPGVDARVGTVKMWSLGADYVPQGWRLLPAGLVGAFPRYSSYDGILVPEVEIPSHDHSWGPLAYDTWSWQDIVGEPGTAVLKSIREDVMPGDFNGTTSSTELDYFPPHFGILFIERYHVGT
ncbi:MAG: hypothetical protein IMZ62_02580 [Chloroflexi bacterium]|nr:hypothetical protein [Chloroflexota bacterium]